MQGDGPLYALAVGQPCNQVGIRLAKGQQGNSLANRAIDLIMPRFKRQQVSQHLLTASPSHDQPNRKGCSLAGHCGIRVQNVFQFLVDYQVC